MLDVLIIGAGPTGLVLALMLKKLGINPRIIDKAAEPGTASRALAVHARTLEFYDMLGIADAAVALGRKMEAVNYWAEGKKRARVFLGDIGAGLSPYPYVLILPQDVHERLLTAELEKLGVRIERRTEFVRLTQNDGAVEAVLSKDGREENCQARYLCGCDGARSAVREALQIGFSGGTYSQIFYVADVAARGEAANGELHIYPDVESFAAIFPLKEDGHIRLVGIFRSGGGHAGASFEDVRPEVEELTKADITSVNWFSVYHVHHRVADSFRQGRVFLLGDAGHIHSPAGGQGMNTGIGDAVNLAWKLAEVLKDRAEPRLLDSYEPERIAFARLLVQTTDRGFSLAVDPSFLPRFTRFHLLPMILPAATSLEFVRRYMFKVISQIRIQYEASPLSSGSAGNVRGGDRLPWIHDMNGESNFAPLKSLSWQVHVYGQTRPDFEMLANSLSLPVQHMVFTEGCLKAGLMRDAAYLIRPDGYVALASPAQDPAVLSRYLDTAGLRPA